MKFYGHSNLQQNEPQNAVLTTVTSFPTTPVVGQIAFVNSIVYICVTAGALPVWVPLTREITAYTHVQSTPSSSWTVQHDLNTSSVNVQIYDVNGKVIIPDEITSITTTSLTVDFSTGVAGRAVCVAGSLEGNPKPAYAYTFYQDSASTTWTIDHNLGYYPIVRIFIGTNEVQPQSISHPTANQTVVTFSTPEVGYARLV